MVLDNYNEKRNFGKTKEPEGDSDNQSGGEKIFVIQKHKASSLHYDFRLEVGGILKSWAVPKGPSMNPSEKRLAVLVEDHPKDYADFEGVIPEGEYGAGQVIVWDRGSYKNNSKNKEDEDIEMNDTIRRGLIEIELKGKKINGGYGLKRMGNADEKNWLLIKKNDKYADIKIDIKKNKPQSVISGKEIEDIK